MVGGNMLSILDYINSDIFSQVYDGKLPDITSNNVISICRELYYAIKSGEKIFIYGDYDMDGFCASMVWVEVLSTLYNVSPEVFMYNNRTHNIDNDIVSQVDKSGARIVLILDTGSSEVDHQLVSILALRGHIPIVIDHHNWQGVYEEYSKEYYVYNSFMEKNKLGGYEVSGAYASLLVADLLCKEFNHSLSYNAMVYALASMYSDVVDLSTPPGRALYNLVSSVKMPGPNLFLAMNEWNYSFSRRFFSYIIAPKINACFRTENFSPLNKALVAKDRYSMNKVIQSFKEVHNESIALVNTFIKTLKRERFGGIVLCVHEATDETKMLHVRNFSGLMANAVAKEEKSMVIVVIKDDNTYSGSYRDFHNRKMLNKFKLFCEAEGHDTAFAVSFYDYKDFVRHLKALSNILITRHNMDYNVLSSSLITSKEDIQVLAVYNEFMNVKSMAMINHRCEFARTIKVTQYKRFYDVGLPYNVISVYPLLAGSNILLEPTITGNVELRCVE